LLKSDLKPGSNRGFFFEPKSGKFEKNSVRPLFQADP